MVKAVFASDLEGYELTIAWSDKLTSSCYRVSWHDSKRTVAIRVSRPMFSKRVSPDTPVRVGGISVSTANAYMSLVAMLACQLFVTRKKGPSRLAALGLDTALQWSHPLDGVSIPQCTSDAGSVVACLAALDDTRHTDTEAVIQHLRLLLALPSELPLVIRENRKLQRTVYRASSDLSVDVAAQKRDHLYYVEQGRVAVFYHRFVAATPGQWTLLAALDGLCDVLQKKTGTDYRRLLGLVCRDPSRHWYTTTTSVEGDLPPKMITWNAEEFRYGYRPVATMTEAQVDQLIADMDRPHLVDVTAVPRERVVELRRQLLERLAEAAAAAPPRRKRRRSPGGGGSTELQERVRRRCASLRASLAPGSVALRRFEKLWRSVLEASPGIVPTATGSPC